MFDSYCAVPACGIFCLVLMLSAAVKFTCMYTLNPFHVFFLSGEDAKLGKCLHLVGVTPQETRDKEGKERFIVMEVHQMLHGILKDWFYKHHDGRGTMTVRNKKSSDL